LLASAVSAQWVPNGTQLFDVPFGPALATSDGRSGAVVLAAGSTQLVTRVTDAGRIPAGWPSSAVPATFVASGLAGDEAGGAYVALFHQGPGNNEVVVHHVLADGTSDPSWPAGGRILDAPAEFGIQNCQLISDGGGGVYAVWFTYTTGADSQTVLRATRLKRDSSVSPGWPAAGRLLYQGPREVAIDTPHASSAGLLVTGSYVLPPYPGQREEPFIARLAPDGSTPAGWPDSIGPVPFTLSGYVPQYTPDANGGVYCTWSNSVLGRLVHIRSDATLDPAWPDSGLTLLPKSTPYQYLTSPVGDGAGGCFTVLAYDSAGSAGTPVGLVPHLVRINESGQVVSGWPALGVRLPFDQAQFNNYLELVPDGAGGVYSLWFDEMDASYNFGAVAAHHTTAMGQTPASWPSGGLVLARAPGMSWSLEGISDGHGGLIAVWEDSRNDPDVGVFALGIGPDGQPTTGVRDPIVSAFSTFTVSPHPARGPLRLSFSLASATSVTLDVMDIAGRRVRQLENGLLAPGQHAIPWDGTDDDGRTLPPGVYLARARAAGVVRTARIVRLD